MKGSLTVEAAYILPFCFFVIGVVCYLGIFTYNKAVLKMTGYECILQTMEQREVKESLFLDSLLSCAMENAKERTLGMEVLDVEARITSSQISLNFQGVQGFFQTPMEVCVVYERKYPEMIFRMMGGKAADSYERAVEAGIE